MSFKYKQQHNICCAKWYYKSLVKPSYDHYLVNVQEVYHKIIVAKSGGRNILVPKNVAQNKNDKII